MAKLIGFATQYYTLWEHYAAPQYQTDANGNHVQVCTIHHYTYIKNISKDKDAAMAAYPGAELDESLRGHSNSFQRTEWVKHPYTHFTFGKHYGRSLEDVLATDPSYLVWASENCKPLVQDAIIALPGFQEAKANHERLQAMELGKAPALAPGQEVEVEFTSNGFNYDPVTGECSAKATYQDTVLYVNIPGAKEVRGMYPYIMPAINGKAQKTKGKKLQVKVLKAGEPYRMFGKPTQDIWVA